MVKKLALLVLLSLTSACSSWVYRIDIPQGNFIDKKSVDKLQLGMTKEQVKFVLGGPVVKDSFEDNIWHYVYQFKSGKDSALNKQKRFVLTFEDEKLLKASGDFELPESFFTPIEN